MWEYPRYGFVFFVIEQILSSGDMKRKIRFSHSSTSLAQCSNRANRTLAPGWCRFYDSCVENVGLFSVNWNSYDGVRNPSRLFNVIHLLAFIRFSALTRDARGLVLVISKRILLGGSVIPRYSVNLKPRRGLKKPGAPPPPPNDGRGIGIIGNVGGISVGGFGVVTFSCGALNGFCGSGPRGYSGLFGNMGVKSNVLL